MAVRWSGTDVVAEFRDLQAHAMAIDCKGQRALIAGKRHFALADLDNPSENVKKAPRQSKWEISSVQWNPHMSHSQVFVSACNQRADIWTWDEASCSQLGSLKSHTRVISDMDWSPNDTNVLATSSVDTFTYIWDTRDHKKPVLSLEAVAGVSQVKWNKISSNLLATAHDRDIRVWDPRKGNSPIQYISGHLSKIHGLDWNPYNEYHLATSSQDCTVKFWDVSNPRQAELKLTSMFPVFRARYTPFGRGIVTAVLPGMRRSENSLLLWCLDDIHQPVHTFVGHTDVVLEFHWRKVDNSMDQDDNQLVTWSKDQSLRIWRIDSSLLKLCGQEIDGHEGENGIISHLPAHIQTPPASIGPEVYRKKEAPDKVDDRDTSDGKATQPPDTLQQEFELVNVNTANVSVTGMDEVLRTFTVMVSTGKHLVTLAMSFPDDYPVNSPPSFKFVSRTSIDKTTQVKLLKVLHDTSLMHVKHSRSCIEPCLRQLVNNLETLTQKERKSPDDPESGFGMQSSSVINPPAFLPIMRPYIPYEDASVPFPRTSGARFCGAGYLVCFTRRTMTDLNRRMSVSSDLTPRALTALHASAFGRSGLQRTPTASQAAFRYSANRSPPADNNLSILNYYSYRDKKRPRSKRTKDVDSRPKDSPTPTKKQGKVGPVIIYDTCCLLPIHKKLAENYIIDSENVTEMCHKNAAVAATVGRKDLVQVWSLAAMATSKTLMPDNDPDGGAPWAFHPFGRKLFKSLIQHYSRIYDVQTLAMLCCTFGTKNENIRDIYPQPPMRIPSITLPSNITASNNVPTDTSLPSPDISNGWVIPIEKLKRSTSCENFSDNYRFDEEPKDPIEREREAHRQNIRILDVRQNSQYDQFKKAYADLLYRWNYLGKRAEVLKYITTPPEPHKGIEFNNICDTCSRQSRGAQCYQCKGHVFICSICHIVVKGISNFCLMCGHGGHAMHMMDWFRTHDVCPQGCGCNCLESNPMIDDARGCTS